MKKILTAAAIALLLLLVVSCNLDGEEGLVQAAGNSTKLESYMTLEILGNNGTDGLFVSTSKGLALYSDRSFSFSDFSGTNGNLARKTIAVTGAGTYFYEEDGNIKDETGTTRWSGYNVTAIKSMRGNAMAAVFKTTAGFAIYAGDPELFDEPTAVAEPSGESIISIFPLNETEFSVTTRLDETTKYYIYDGTNYTSETSYVAGKAGDVIIYGNGKIKVNGTVLEDKVTSQAKYEAVLSDGTFTYIIPSLSGKVYQIENSTGTLESKAISGLNTLDVLSILKIDGNNIYVMTSNSGSWKINYSSKNKAELKDLTPALS